MILYIVGSYSRKYAGVISISGISEDDIIKIVVIEFKQNYCTRQILKLVDSFSIYEFTLLDIDNLGHKVVVHDAELLDFKDEIIGLNQTKGSRYRLCLCSELDWLLGQCIDYVGTSFVSDEYNKLVNLDYDFLIHTRYPLYYQDGYICYKNNFVWQDSKNSNRARMLCQKFCLAQLYVMFFLVKYGGQVIDFDSILVPAGCNTALNFRILNKAMLSRILLEKGAK